MPIITTSLWKEMGTLSLPPSAKTKLASHHNHVTEKRRGVHSQRHVSYYFLHNLLILLRVPLDLAAPQEYPRKKTRSCNFSKLLNIINVRKHLQTRVFETLILLFHFSCRFLLAEFSRPYCLSHNHYSWQALTKLISALVALHVHAYVNLHIRVKMFL